MSSKKSVLIVDDHPLFREGLKSIIAGDRHFVVEGEAGDARNGYATARKIKPDVVPRRYFPARRKRHATRPGGSRKALPSTRVMIISMHSKIDYIAGGVSGRRNGLRGQGFRRQPPDSGIARRHRRRVLSGQFYFPRSCGAPDEIALFREARVSDSDYGRLTPREQEIMRMLAEGIAKTEIANRLCISVKTVENHRSNIMKKLDLHSTMDLVRYARQAGANRCRSMERVTESFR